MIRRSTKHDTPSPAGLSEAAPLEYNQCQEAVKRLTEYLSNELEPKEEEAVQNHLSQCRGCFAKFQFEEKLLHTIRQKVEQVRAPQLLRDKILGLISTPKV
jgi:anti-sigma factor (TIGR02949 family)